MPKFLLKFNAAVIKEIPITKDIITIGRKEDNDIPIDNPAVSGHHCKIRLEGDTYFVEDLNSTNGTFVNEKKVVKAGLKHNDVIGVVKHALVFFDEKAAAAPPAAEGTVVLTAASSQAMAEAAAAGAKTANVGILRGTTGVVDKPEYILNGASTYIGKSDKVQIPIKGMFTPEVAAMIARRPEGYFLCALQAGYPKLNGLPVQEKAPLNQGDQIEVGGTVFQFSLETPK